MKGVINLAVTGKLTKNLTNNLGAGLHGDVGGYYVVVDSLAARRWIVPLVVEGQRSAVGARFRTDFRLGVADVVSLMRWT